MPSCSIELSGFNDSLHVTVYVHGAIVTSLLLYLQELVQGLRQINRKFVVVLIRMASLALILKCLVPS